MLAAIHQMGSDEQEPVPIQRSSLYHLPFSLSFVAYNDFLKAAASGCLQHPPLVRVLICHTPLI